MGFNLKNKLAGSGVAEPGGGGGISKRIFAAVKNASAGSSENAGGGGFKGRIRAALQAQEAQEAVKKGAPAAARKDNMAGMAIEAKKGGLMKKKMVKKSCMSDKAGRAMKKTTADAKGRAMKKGK